MAIALLAGGIVASFCPAVWSAAGSWVAELPRQVIAVSERPLESRPISAPDHVGGTIDRVSWSFQIEPRTQAQAGPLRAWLCQASLCVPLAAAAGETARFAGRAADAPFRFRFQRPPAPGLSGSLVVSRGQITVNYRQ
ncbi:flagellar protein FlhE [Salinicola rhizosphaerae]|uniref:Flagellar protein FlhE n=1 Tax=Salinicola rhizosphaerae TaxID=1443141 RepID=A0ABQ3DQA5_9GAMM|nr:flagellar protein FlhE [Salinicola rhizosphaerae]GHB10171.1 hypothetical protein GCM10009038_04910 [Salinicola rhizosphaerae]